MNLFCFDRMLRKFVPKGPFDNESAFVEEITWHEKGDGHLPESVIIKVPGAIKCH